MSTTSGVVTLLLVILPTLGPRIYTSIARLRNPQPPGPHGPDAPPKPKRRTPLTTFITALVVVHSLYIAFHILFAYPTNIFTSLGLSLATPTPLIRQTILASYLHESDTLPPQLEALLVRLQSFDARELYVRFGQDSVADCDWCHSFYDFAIFAAPPVALQYVRTIALIGLMTVPGSGKRKWRSWAVGLVIFAVALETYMLNTVSIQSPRNGEKVTMWHDKVWYFRQGLFLLLPILLNALPYSYRPRSPLTTLPPALQSMETTVAQMRILDAVRTASWRNDQLRGSTTEYWLQQARNAELVRADAEIREEAERVGMGYAPAGETSLEGDDSPLLAQAKLHVKQWKDFVLTRAWGAVHAAGAGEGDVGQPT